MVSAIDRAKRALVTLLKSLATVYGLVLSVTRDATDKEILSAYRKVSRKAHPDQGTTNSHAPDCSKKPRSAFEVGSDQGIRQLYAPILHLKLIPNSRWSQRGLIGDRQLAFG